MPQRSIISTQIICRYANNLGVPLDALLKNTGIHPEQLQQGDTQVEDQQELQVLENLLQQVDDPTITGMELGSCYQLTSYGIFGYALLASSTLRKAITFGQQYLALTYIFSEMHLIEEAGNAYLEIRCPKPGPIGQLLGCRDVWAALVIMQEIFPQQVPNILVELDMPEPANFSGTTQSKLLQQSGVHWRFNAGRHALSGIHQLLDLPLPKANAVTAQMCEQQCRQLLDQNQQTPENAKVHLRSVSQQVRDHILKLGLTTNMEQVAQTMARTSRTLHRQLKSEGNSWRQVMDEVRMGLAEEYLKQPFSLEQIAERLGYSDTANFSHAFKRCRGIAPSVYRHSFHTTQE